MVGVGRPRADGARRTVRRDARRRRRPTVGAVARCRCRLGSTAGIASLAWLGTETPLSLSLLTATNAVEPGTDRPRGCDSGGSRSGR
ncbi:hypothetical protein [Rathayibacter agropyri]|uniref:hypothetical protein n=1 Tax=Rathayibacter agropyri TaxID=1634927 RepID=UPI001564E7B1